MGYYPTDRISIDRRYDPREIVVRWEEAYLGKQEKRFAFNAIDEVLDFVKMKMTELAM